MLRIRRGANALRRSNVSSPNPEQSRWFVEEVLPHEAKLRAWLRVRFPSVADADDLVQEAYARLMQAHATGPIACPRALLLVTTWRATARGT